MGSFSWLRADRTTKRSNLTKGDRYKILIPKEFGADLSKIHTMIMDMFFMGQKMKQIYMGFWHIGMVVRVWIIRMNVGIIQKQWKKS